MRCRRIDALPRSINRSGAVDAHLPGLVQRDQDRGRDEADRRTAGLRRVGLEVVVGPAAVDHFVAVQHVDLLGDQLADLLAPQLVVRPAAAASAPTPESRRHEPKCCRTLRAGAADVGQFREQPLLAAVDRLGDFRPVAARFDQRRDAQAGHRRAKRVMRARHRRQTSPGRVLSADPQEPFAFCRFSRKSTPRRIVCSNSCRRGRRNRLGLGDRSRPRPQAAVDPPRSPAAGRRPPEQDSSIASASCSPASRSLHLASRSPASFTSRPWGLPAAPARLRPVP